MEAYIPESDAMKSRATENAAGIPRNTESAAVKARVTGAL